MSTLQSYQSYEWTNQNGLVVSHLAAPQLTAGSYVLEADDGNGCSSKTNFTILEKEKPEVFISAPSFVGGLCPGSAGATIYATQTGNGYLYQWYKDGIKTGSGQATLAVNESGIYYVVVTNENGCTGQSNSIYIPDCEAAGGHCENGQCVVSSPSTCNPQGTADFTWNNTTCNEFQFNNLSVNAIPGTWQWQFQDGSSVEEHPSHNFSHPGFFSVILAIETPNLDGSPPTCYIGKHADIVVPLQAAFEVEGSCTGLAVRFTDVSNYLPNTSISGWHWDFDDPASGSANASGLQHPEHVFSAPGSYNVTLLATSSEGCTAVFSKEITIHAPPAVSFGAPAALCAATALHFEADAPADVAVFSWDFGDAGSGDANFSQKENTYHAYPFAGQFEVALTAESIYGCRQTFTSSVSIEANDLSGNITPDDPAPICEGTQASFQAPPGGVAWAWSSGGTGSGITTSEAGIYEVTLTDSKGCEYSPPAVGLEVLPAPVALIRAVELNEFGQPTAYHENSYSTCEGNEVYLEMNGNPRYFYQWPDGTTGGQLALTEEGSGLLPVGNHEFSVTVTEVVSGCTAVVGPFPVSVHALPSEVSISSDPPGPLCAGGEADFFVENADPANDYLWNTGQTGTSISAFAGGTYLVLATNSFGCTAKSNEIEIHNAPGLGNLVSGCFTACESKEICLPDLPEVADYQWLLNGSPIAAPEGNAANYEATETGDYQVHLTSIYGCETVSEAVSISILPEQGEVSGHVWIDLNGNGEVDAADSLLSGIPVLLTENGAALADTFSNENGQYFFGEMPGGAYQLGIDLNGLPAYYTPIIFSENISIEGCGDTSVVDFLLDSPCLQAIETALQFAACGGENILFNNTEIAAGETREFVLPSFLGCDSTVVVSVEEIVVEPSTLQFAACGGESILFNNTEIAAGETREFVLPSFRGCDSTVVVSVGILQADSTFLELNICESDTLDYQGFSLLPGDEMVLELNNQAGCDSLVFISVAAFPALSFELQPSESCPDEGDGTIEVVPLSGTPPFRCAIGGGAFQAQTVFANLKSGIYEIAVEDANGCAEMQAVEVLEKPPLDVLVEDYALPCDDPQTTVRPVVLSHAGAVNWRWEDGSSEAWMPVEDAGIYHFEVSDECATEALEATVKWAEGQPDSYFYIPNAFSPNGDGVNDKFQVYAAQGIDIQSFELHVFNRWGAHVFFAGQPANGWDGGFKGKTMNPGVYAWYLKARVRFCGVEKEVFREGDVVILK